MTDYVWKIDRVTVKDDLIISAHYSVKATSARGEVETEGNWNFGNPQLTVPYADVTEDMIAEWIQSETTQAGRSTILARLDEQIDTIQPQNPPWMAAKIFKLPV